MQGQTRFAVRLGDFCRLGWWVVVAVGVVVWMARYLMGFCTLSGSGGWRSAWREPWGKSCLKESLPYGMGSLASMDKQGRRCLIGFAVEMHL